MTTLLKPGLLALGLLLAAVLVVGFASRALRLASESESQGSPAMPVVPNATSTAGQVDSVPGMDAAAAANTETATFALG